MASYLINMTDGRLVFRNSETDAQVNLKPVPDAVVGMILKGEVTDRDVINAISAKIKESGDFNLEEYIRELKKLNVRQSNPQGVPERETLKDRTDEEISANEVLSAREKVDPKATKKERVKKVNDVLDAEPKSDASGIEDVFSK